MSSIVIAGDTSGTCTLQANAVAGTTTLTLPTTSGTLYAKAGGGAIGVADGGTGATTLTGYVKGNGTSAMTASATVPTSDLTGTLGVANGGTGATTLTADNVILGNGTSVVKVVAPGTANNVLTSNGTTWVSSAPAAGYVGVTTQVFTSNGTFTIPTGITKLKVTVIGGGGAGGYADGNTGQSAGGGGGGGGGTAIKWLTGLTPGNTITVTVGAAGNATSTTSGGSSNIASGTQTITTVTGSGGTVGASASNGSSNGGAGGGATNGDLNIAGGNGCYGNSSGNTDRRGGTSILSNPTLATNDWNTTQAYLSKATSGNGYGGGGRGGYSVNSDTVFGGDGSAGVVIFEW